MKSRITRKLAASFAVVLLLFTAVLGMVFLALFRQHTIEINRLAMEQKATSIADTLSAFQSEGTGMMHSGMGGYGAYLRFLGDIAMSEVWVVDENLNLLTFGSGGAATEYASLPENAGQIVRRVMQGEVTYGENFSGLLDAPALTVGAPIRSGGRVVGAVLLHSPVSGIDDAVRQGLSALAAGATVALLFAGVAAVLLSYRFTIPLQRMKTAALRLADGDYAAQTGVTERDEIGQLAQTIDQLAGRLAQAERQRAALDKLKENFVANVSHELRTPVAVLRGSLEVLQDGTVNDPQEIQEYYAQMLLESRYLERLVNDLLDLSRLQDEQFRLEMGDVSLCEVVRDAARAMRRAMQEKQLVLSAACPEEACVVFGDYGRIRQMLLILLDNAVKFSKPGGTIEMALRKTETRFVLSVTDHGTGIPPEEFPYIFDRFRKAHSAQNQAGTGLGLAIAKQIAERHHAALKAESDAAHTCFSISFPPAQVEHASEKAAVSS
ncbi:MAG: ATP-binding protein [Novosphingobium sp.]